jgi:hypothetical protein
MPGCSTDIPREFGANDGLKLQGDRDCRAPGRALPEGLNPLPRFDDLRPNFLVLCSLQMFAANSR